MVEEKAYYSQRQKRLGESRVSEALSHVKRGGRGSQEVKGRLKGLGNQNGRIIQARAAQLLRKRSSG